MPRPEPVTIATLPSSCPISTPSSLCDELRHAVAQDDYVAPDDARAEASAPVAFVPDLGADSLARIHWCGEADIELSQAFRVAGTERFEYRVARDAVSAQSMQNRPIEARCCGDRWI